jgi:nicotinamide mononucleotide transporter
LSIHEIYLQLITDIHQAKWYEYVAVISGIASVWYSRKENILVYPVGLINTILYVYISIQGSLLGEAGVNLYYTIMSFIGWWQWLRKDVHQQAILHITLSNAKEWLQQLLFFGAWYIGIFIALVYFKKQFLSGAIPWADAFAAATAFTGMWLMTRKKLESWYWWIATNIAAIPLYFVKHYVLTSFYYLILLVMAISGLIEWRRRIRSSGSGF